MEDYLERSDYGDYGDDLIVDSLFETSRSDELDKLLLECFSNTKEGQAAPRTLLDH